MKEMLMVMASAWSAAFIILFFVVIASPMPIPPGREDARSLMIVVLLIGAISGSGWLRFRHEMKKLRKPTARSG